MTLITLYLWVAVAGRTPEATVRDWRPSGEFATVQHCEKAAERLGYVGSQRARCIDTGRPAK